MQINKSTQNSPFNIVVLAKQVPDTRNVGKDAMKADGTVNRAALPAIFNPEDLNALEMALQIKDRMANVVITVITMGPVRAADIIREALYRGADRGVLITDKRFAGSDTLATSYAISLAIKKINHVNLVISGRQAIDGDTAQVGPQIAEKLNIPQITYAEELIDINDNKIKIKRRLERGIEVVESSYPCLVTVHDSAPQSRFKIATRVMCYKKALTISERQAVAEDYARQSHHLSTAQIEEWSASDLNADFDLLGLSGSPTKVKKIDNVVLSKKESKILSPSDQDIKELINDLVVDHLI